MDDGRLRELEPTLSMNYRWGVLLDKHGFIVDPDHSLQAIEEVCSKGRRGAVETREDGPGGIHPPRHTINHQ